MLSFGVLIAFLSPKQSEIEESSLESLSKSKIQGVWDPVHSTRLPKAFHLAAATLHPAAKSFPFGYAAIYIQLPPLYTRLPKAFHPATPPFTSSCRHFTFGWRRFHPDVLHPEICCHHSTRMYCIWNYDAGWKRRAFQFPQSDISGSADSAHPEDFAAILHSAAVFSWSFPLCATNIFRYFSLDIYL